MTDAILNRPHSEGMVTGSDAGPITGESAGAEVPGGETPRLAVVVVSSASPAALRLWLDPIAADASAHGLEIIVVREAPVPEMANWSLPFEQVQLVVAAGDRTVLKRAGAAATRADILMFTEDTDQGAHRRLIRLAQELGLRKNE